MQLRKYQIEGADKLIQFLNARNAAYLADEMGCGKTAQACDVLNSLGAGHVLIVCPAILRLNWQRELIMWSERDSKCIFSSKDNLDGKVLIVSYDLATMLHTKLNRKWDLIIFDEAHFLKSPTAKRTKVCLRKLFPLAKKRLFLSGTPTPNGIIDGFAVFNRIAPDLFPNYDAFGRRYTNAELNWFVKRMYNRDKWEYRGGRNLKELKDLIYNNFLVRRRKKDVLSELPPKQFSQIDIQIDRPEQYALSPEVLSAVQASQSNLVAPATATQRKALGMSKVPAAIEHIKLLMAEKNRLVIFAYHKDVINSIASEVSNEYTAHAITGDVPMPRRQEIIDEFQGRLNTKHVLVCQTHAAGVGITLTAADVCEFVELDWTPAVMQQCIDRLHRIGQENRVQINYLTACKTMDEQIITSLRQKVEAITEAIG